jgi:WD40 repeat protein
VIISVYGQPAAERLATEEVSKDGDYLVAAGGNGTITVIDLQTSLVTSYKGHRARLTAMATPTREYPFFLSADVRGAIRAWPLPNRLGKHRPAGSLRQSLLIATVGVIPARCARRRGAGQATAAMATY